MKQLLFAVLVPVFAIAAMAAPVAGNGRHATSKMAQKTMAAQWAPENLTGTVSTVDPARNLVIVRDSSGTPFDFVVTHSTRIAGHQAHKLSQLAANDRVSVRLVPEKRGDVARKIAVNP
jgi:hypothetical protein